jgi:hypothetical protein
MQREIELKETFKLKSKPKENIRNEILHENIQSLDLMLLLWTHFTSILSLSYNCAPIYSFINVITKQIVGFKVYTLEVFGGNFDQNHARG